MSATSCVAAAIVTVLMLAQPCRAQTADPRGDFIRALGRLSLDLDGAFGHEAMRLPTDVDALDAALAAWGAVVQRYEAAMRAEIGGADPVTAARMHLALGGVYLDRGDAPAALGELSAASQLEAARPQATFLAAIARAQLTADRTATVSTLRTALADANGDPVRSYALGRHLAANGDRDGAARAFAAVRPVLAAISPSARPAVAPFIRLELAPESAGVEPYFPPANYREGFELLERRSYSEGMASLRQALRDDRLVQVDDAQRQRLGAASVLFRAGSIDAAVAALREAIAASPDMAEPHRLLGLVHAANEDHAAAIDELRTAVRLDAANERARLSLAESLLTAGRTADAERTLRDTLAAIPASGRAHYALGRLLQRDGRYAEAITELQQAAASRPLLGMNSIVGTLGALAVAQQSFDDAIKAYERQVDLIPNDAGAHQTLGGTYARTGRDDDALTEFAAALMLRPDYPEAYVSAAQIHLRNAHAAEAATLARHAIAIDPRYREAHYVLGTALIRVGRRDEGEQTLATYQQLQTEDAAARSRQLEVEGFKREAAVALAAADYRKAIEMRRRVLEADPDSADGHADLARALAAAGQDQEAITEFTAAIQRRDAAALHRELADSYRRIGDTAGTVREAARYRELKEQAIRQAAAAR